MLGRQRTWLLTVLACALSSGPAWAHIDLNYPPSRGGNQKVGVCGGVGYDVGPVTEIEPGAQITVSIAETIGHPGHFRIMFDADATDGDDFPNPTNCDDVGTPDGQTLLADYLLPAQGGACPGFHTPSERTPTSGTVHTFDITLPDVECDSCTLQVIQVMTDSGKTDADGNWIPSGGGGLYFRCANLSLVRGAGVPDGDAGSGPGTSPPPGAVGASCSASGGSSGQLGVWLVLLFATTRRRRR